MVLELVDEDIVEAFPVETMTEVELRQDIWEKAVSSWAVLVV